MTLASIASWAAQHFHPHLIFYTAIVLILLYKPPSLFRTFTGMADFLSRHFGDTIGFYFVHLGIALQIVAGVYSQLSHIDHVGESLLLMGVGILKLKYNPAAASGNGKEPISPVTPIPLQQPPITQSVVPPPPAPPASDVIGHAWEGKH